MSHKKFGPDRYSRFDVYWIQTDKQTNKQTDKPNLYIDLDGWATDHLVYIWKKEDPVQIAQGISLPR